MMTCLRKMLVCFLLVAFVFSSTEMDARQVSGGGSLHPGPISTPPRLVTLAVAGRMNTLALKLQNHTAKPADYQAVITSMEIMRDQFDATRVWEEIDAAFKAHHEHTLDYVPSPGKINAQIQAMKSSGLTYATSEDLWKLQTMTLHQKQVAVAYIEKTGMREVFNAHVIGHFQSQLAVLESRAGSNDKLHLANTPDMSFCEMMAVVSFGMDAAGLFGCIPCGFAGLIAGGAAIVCYRWWQ